MFGNKTKKVVFLKEYTIESLFEAIKDKPFTAASRCSSSTPLCT